MVKKYGITISEITENGGTFRHHREKLILEQIIEPEEFNLKLILRAILEGMKDK
jgi:hypothetical protein